MNYSFFNSKYIAVLLLFAISMLHGCSHVTIGDIPIPCFFPIRVSKVRVSKTKI
jgi:hypothetical protein